MANLAKHHREIAQISSNETDRYGNPLLRIRGVDFSLEITHRPIARRQRAQQRQRHRTVRQHPTDDAAFPCCGAEQLYQVVHLCMCLLYADGDLRIGEDSGVAMLQIAGQRRRRFSCRHHRRE